MDSQLTALSADILNFWFGPADPQGHYASREAWWTKEPAFDADLRSRYLASHTSAVAGELGDLKQTATGALSLILILDQFPRNMFRGDPACYAYDGQARSVASLALEAGFDQDLPTVWRWFMYLPFEHSEDLADQDLSVSLFESLERLSADDNTIPSAHRHREIIARFGRFPHRNMILGRQSTLEELEFLKEPKSSF